MKSQSAVTNTTPKVTATPTDPIERGKYYKEEWRKGLAEIRILQNWLLGLQEKIEKLESEVERKKNWQPPQFYEDPDNAETS